MIEELLNLKCQVTDKPIGVYQNVYVKNTSGDILGWGWFEWEPDLRRFWFREDYIDLLPQGMDTEILENIFAQEFELYV